jgi:hypothetical protein
MYTVYTYKYMVLAHTKTFTIFHVRNRMVHTCTLSLSSLRPPWRAYIICARAHLLCTHTHTHTRTHTRTHTHIHTHTRTHTHTHTHTRTHCAGDPLLALPFFYLPLLNVGTSVKWTMPDSRDPMDHHIFPKVTDWAQLQDGPLQVTDRKYDASFCLECCNVIRNVKHVGLARTVSVHRI